MLSFWLGVNLGWPIIPDLREACVGVFHCREMLAKILSVGPIKGVFLRGR